jgi:7-carboxy-7-deazaguanine synthase
MIAKISEIFRSLQGEGLYVGIPQVFVRFWGCNMSCAWCDTPASRQGSQFHIFTAAQLRNKVVALAQGCHSVSLTGGEPLLQAEFLSGFLPLLRTAKVKTYLETNGVCAEALKKIIKGVDIIAMDIKLPSSTGDQPCWEEHEKFLRVAVKNNLFIKAVVGAKTRKTDILQMTRLIRVVARATPLVLQPQAGRDHEAAVRKCLAYQQHCLKYLHNVRVVPQVHKLMKIK